MSLKSVIKSIFGSAPAKAIAAVVLTDVQKAVAALKATDIGATVATDIKTLTSSSISGAAKFEQVVATTAPLVLKYVTTGGVAAAASDVEDIARELVQSVFNDTVSKAPSIASAILKLLGVS